MSERKDGKANGAPGETDVVVVGAGGAGLAAALSAAQTGARLVVFEKQGAIGGTTRFAEGMFAVQSEIQRADYVAMTRDEAFKMIMEYSHWRANARLVRAFVDESAGTISWLQRQGVEFIGVKPMWPDSPRLWHVLKGPVHTRARPMVNTLAAAAKKLGAEIHLKARVVSLLREKGAVCGVMVGERGGVRREVRASSVVVASGGYSNDAQLINEYTGLKLGENVFPISNTGKDGDGLRMAWEAGAAQEGMGVLQLTGGGPVGPGFNSALASQLAWISCFPGLWVNANGERFCDESTSYFFPHLANAIARQPGSFAFAVFDESQERDMAERGVDFSMGMFLQPGTRLQGLREIMEGAKERGNPNIIAADSLAELAAGMGVGEDRLRGTFDDYNLACDRGRDPFYAKDAKHLFPVQGPRVYAIRCSLGFLSTLGGIKIDHRTQVMDANDDVIPGLYAAGVDAGGLYGDSYDLCAPGSTLGFALTSGRIAGRNAAARAGFGGAEGVAMDTEKGAVVITGCSSGVGWATALLLDGLGYRVFAGVRKEADAQNLRAAASANLTPVFMDITDHESVAQAASAVRAELGGAGLAGLVNNAGGGLSGPFEFTPWDEFVHQVRLNFIGHADVIRSFLALVRQGGGRVVSVGSVGALLPLPFSSAYSSAKAALHAFNASLRVELAPQGIPVVLIVPGAVATRIWDKLESERQRLGALLPEEGRPLYGEMLEQFGEITAELSQVGVAPISVAKLIAHALSWPNPKDEYRIGRDVPRSPRPPR